MYRLDFGVRLPVDMQDERARALLDQPTMHDGEAMKDAVLAMLAHLDPAKETALIRNALHCHLDIFYSQCLVFVSTYSTC